MSRAVVGDTAKARQTCIMCGNFRFPSSDEDSLLNYLLLQRTRI